MRYIIMATMQCMLVALWGLTLGLILGMLFGGSDIGFSV